MEMIYVPCKNTLLYIGYLMIFGYNIGISIEKSEFCELELFQILDE